MNDRTKIADFFASKEMQKRLSCFLHLNLGKNKLEATDKMREPLILKRNNIQASHWKTFIKLSLPLKYIGE